MKFMLKPDPCRAARPGAGEFGFCVRPAADHRRRRVADFTPLAAGGYLPPDAYISVTPLQEVVSEVTSFSCVTSIR